MTFNPTHFVQTDEAGASNNHVENGELLQRTRRGSTNVFSSRRLDDFETERGEVRTIFSTRVQEFDVSVQRVTCEYSSGPHHHTGACRGARVVEPARFSEQPPSEQPELLDVGTVVRRPDLDKDALFVIEERAVDRGYPAGDPYRLRSLTQAVPEQYRGLLWLTSYKVELEVVPPVEAATIMLRESKEATNELVTNLAAALRDAAAELEAVIQ